MINWIVIFKINITNIDCVYKLIINKKLIILLLILGDNLLLK
jgi:hypothetical protein